MPSLVTLPNEVIHKILAAEYDDPRDFNNDRNRINPNYSRRILLSRDLNSLTRVCRKLYHAVNKSLYTFNRDFDNFSLLKTAVMRDNVSTLQVVKELKLDMSRRNGVLLDLAVGLGRREMCVWLLDNGAELEKTIEQAPWGRIATESKLWRAMAAEWEDIAILLLERRATPVFVNRIKNRGFTTALHMAAFMDMPRTVKHLVEVDKVPVDQRDSNGATPLYHAIGAPTRMVKQLIEFGADINISVDGKPLLIKAISRYKFANACELLKAGAQVKYNDGKSYPVHECVGLEWYDGYLRSDQVLLLRKLIEAGADLEERNGSGHTPLQHAIVQAYYDRRLTMLFHLLASGVNTSGILDFIVDNHLHTSVHRVAALLMKIGIRVDQPLTIKPYTFIEWMALCQSRHVVDHLLTVATPKTLNPEHLNYVLVQCLERRYLHICDILVRHGAVVRDPGRAYAAAYDTIMTSQGQYMPHRRERWFDMLLGAGIAPEKIASLVTHAFEERDEVSVNYLLCRFGPDLTNPDPQWLHMASKWGIIYIMRKLLTIIKDVNVLSKDSRTPLTDAVAPGTKRAILICLLLHHDANPFLPSNTPLFSKETDWKTVRYSPGVSAFEIAIRDDRLLPVVQEMWRGTPSDARPELDAFIACVPDDCPEIAQWLKAAKDGKDPGPSPADFVGRYHDLYNIDDKEDWGTMFLDVNKMHGMYRSQLSDNDGDDGDDDDDGDSDNDDSDSYVDSSDDESDDGGKRDGYADHNVLLVSEYCWSESNIEVRYKKLSTKMPLPVLREDQVCPNEYESVTDESQIASGGGGIDQMRGRGWKLGVIANFLLPSPDRRREVGRFSESYGPGQEIMVQ
ncbi:ankyrin repeat-containing domain protein [Hypoxylon cercidicola]|nr:ankyrin repeat-containing domain protein [Hypoxylon cercidicola]